VRPAICRLCGKPAFDEPTSAHGGWIEFSNFRPLDKDSLGNPEGLEYFCDEHNAPAMLLSSKTSTEAVIALQKQFVDLPPYLPRDLHAPRASLFKRLFSKKNR
jgi:hypothetical protein